MTFGEFAELWTSNELARRYRRRIKEIDHTENRRRLKNHILSVVFRGRTIGDTPLSEFTLDHADHVLAQPRLLRVHSGRLPRSCTGPSAWLNTRLG
jgi:hypothetical protein